MERIYLDNAASTPLLPEVIETMKGSMDDHFGNPSSIHHYGRISKAAVESARKVIANGLSCSIGEIFFTSSATEANNLFINQAIKNLGVQRIISCSTEHPCVKKCIDQYADDLEIIFLSTDKNGSISLDELNSLLSTSNKKTLVSLMHSNNEIGTFHPFEKIAECCSEHAALYHCDAVQSIAKVPIDLSNEKVSFLSGSAHKFHGPKGIGFMYINGNNIVDPSIIGGAQERNMRAGTENIIGISGMSRAFELAQNSMEERKIHILKIKNKLKEGLKELVPNILFNGDEKNSLHTILNCSFPKSEFADMIMFNLDINGICASAGSACSSGIEQASPVLTAIGHDPERKAIRFSFSHLNTVAEINYTLEKIKSFI